MNIFDKIAQEARDANARHIAYNAAQMASGKTEKQLKKEWNTAFYNGLPANMKHPKHLRFNK